MILLFLKSIADVTNIVESERVSNNYKRLIYHLKHIPLIYFKENWKKKKKKKLLFNFVLTKGGGILTIEL